LATTGGWGRAVMTDVFISYARSTEPHAEKIAEALRSLGHEVWRDDQIQAHQAFGKVLEERLTTAKVVLVLWSADAADSEWVRSEASRARAMGKLVQLTLDKSPLPMPFDQIQCADLVGWSGEPDAPGWRKVVASIGDLIGGGTVDRPAAGSVQTPLPSKPSIAIMPLANLSGDPEQDYFADGMVTEITSALSRFKSLFVIASSSTLTFKGRAVGAQEAARQLGVRYVLEGSVRKAGHRVRIAVQLIDGAHGSQIWTDRFEDTLEDVFDLQDRVALSVAGAVEPALRESEMRRTSARPTGNLGSYDLYLQALSRQRVFDRPSVLEALNLLTRATALDADFAAPLAQAGLLHFIVYISGWSDDPDFHRRSALEAAHRALQLATDDAIVLALSAFVISRVEHDQAAAIALLDRATALNPGSSVAWGFSGVVRVGNGEDALGIEQIATALRLDPLGSERPAWLGWTGIAQFQQGRYADAATNIRAWLQHADIFLAHGFLAACYGHLGQIAAARASLERYRRATPIPIEHLTNSFPDQTLRRRLQQGIALAAAEAPPKGAAGAEPS